jgi:hypothetical protein
VIPVSGVPGAVDPTKVKNRYFLVVSIGTFFRYEQKRGILWFHNVPHFESFRTIPHMWGVPPYTGCYRPGYPKNPSKIQKIAKNQGKIFVRLCGYFYRFPPPVYPSIPISYPVGTRITVRVPGSLTGTRPPHDVYRSIGLLGRNRLVFTDSGSDFSEPKYDRKRDSV